jgi:phosphoenolpyruvate synthase/pyruvate phosphate dikinase
MVRSSAIGEDGAESSFAGQLSSFISSSQKEDIDPYL